jgi:predicted N-formylglutamate amidohydrolase
MTKYSRLLLDFNRNKSNKNLMELVKKNKNKVIL